MRFPRWIADDIAYLARNIPRWFFDDQRTLCTQGYDVVFVSVFSPMCLRLFTRSSTPILADLRIATMFCQRYCAHPLSFV
jgi:hypothetical protein